MRSRSLPVPCPEAALGPRCSLGPDFRTHLSAPLSGCRWALPPFPSKVLDERRGTVPQNFSRCPEDCFTRSRRPILVSVAVLEPTAFILLKSLTKLLLSSSFSVHEMVYSPFKTKMVAGYDQDSTSGGEGGGTPARSRRKWFAFSRWRLPM